MIELKLDYEGSWALMMEELTVLAHQESSKNIGVKIDNYVSLGQERYYKCYYYQSDLETKQMSMIKLIHNSEKAKRCFEEMDKIIELLDSFGDKVSDCSLIEKFDTYKKYIIKYLIYYNTMFSHRFTEKIYEDLYRNIPKDLGFIRTALKEALLANDTTQLLTFKELIDRVDIAKRIKKGENVEERIRNYKRKYRFLKKEILDDNPKNDFFKMTWEEINRIETKIKCIGVKAENSKHWSETTANRLDLDITQQEVLKTLRILPLYKLKMRESFQSFKESAKKIFLHDLITKITPEIFDYMFTDEIEKFILYGRLPSRNQINKRKSSAIFEKEGGSIYFNRISYEDFFKKYFLGNEKCCRLSGTVVLNCNCRKGKFKVYKLVQNENGNAEFENFISHINYESKKELAVITNTLRPYLVPLLKDIGVLITQQGGYTSHAALLCRELGVKSIIGVEGIMETFSTDEFIEVDFDKGSVVSLSLKKQMEKKEKAHYPDFVRIEANPNQDIRPEIIGVKGYNLVKISKNIRVPKGFIITTYGAEKIYDKVFCQEIHDHIKKLGCNYLAIRSSNQQEDLAHKTYAGLYDSFVNVRAMDQELVTDRIKKVCNSNANEGVEEYSKGEKGKMAIIVQEMISCEISGVVISSEVSESKYMIFEYIFGDLESLMSGKITPYLTTIRRDKIGDKRFCEKCLPPLVLDKYNEQFEELVEISLNLEIMYKSVVEIEWGISDEKLYVFQVRPYQN